MRLRPHNGIDPRFLAAFLRLSHESGQLERYFTGTTIKHLPQAALSRLRKPLAPSQEQQRIAAKIDSLSTRTRRARDQLDRLPRMVEKYRQAILEAAFRGSLIGLAAAPTERFDNTKCWDLPPGWRWVRFSEVAEIASNLVQPETVPDLPHIAPDNIEAGTARLLPYRTIKEDEVTSAKHRFYAGQLLYSKIRPYLRKAIIPMFDGACSADMYSRAENPENIVVNLPDVDDKVLIDYSRAERPRKHPFEGSTARFDLCANEKEQHKMTGRYAAYSRLTLDYPSKRVLSVDLQSA